MSGPTPTIEDPKGLLSSADHERDMERIALQVTRIEAPYPSVRRVVGTVAPKDPQQWLYPNLAVRMDLEAAANGGMINRIYTIRSYDPATHQVEIDFVLHRDDSPAMRWLAQAGAGTVVMMKGPRPHTLPHYETAKPVAIFADDTALPAVQAMLRAWPQDARRGHVWIDTADEAAFAALDCPAGVEKHLLRRPDDLPAGYARLLLAAARQHLSAPLDWTVWAAGERAEMQELRSFLKSAGLMREDMRLLGYWRLGQTSSELDIERLAIYERIRSAGLGLEELRDLEAAP